MKKLTVILMSLASAFLLFGSNHTEVTISGNDSMQFDVKSFNASAGSDFKLTFKNTGKLPKKTRQGKGTHSKPKAGKKRYRGQGK